MRDFVLEMGKDFLYMGEEYFVHVGGETRRLDLLFYHRGLRCLVDVELKAVGFQPEFVSKLDMYLEAIDRGHYVLSRRYYIQKGEPGTHTRRVGLVAEECKALIEKHIRLSGNKGVPFKEFQELLSGTPTRRISYFLDQMKKIGIIRSEGRGRGALWFVIEQKQGE